MSPYGDSLYGDSPYGDTTYPPIALEGLGNLSHSHSIAGVTLGGIRITITGVGKLTHSHLIQTVGLTQHEVLAVNKLTHTESISTVVLTTTGLVVAKLNHLHTIQTFDIATAGAVIETVDNLAHSETIQATYLIQHNLLYSEDNINLRHDHFIGSVYIAHPVLVVNNLSHAHHIGRVVFGWEDSTIDNSEIWIPYEVEDTEVWESASV